MDIQTKVAYACNILSMAGHTDTIYGHVSARVENAEHIWMKPATLGLEKVRPHDRLTLDLDSKNWREYYHATCNFRSTPQSIASAPRSSASFIRHPL